MSLILQGPWLRDLPNASLVGSGDEILAWEGDGTSPQNCREEWESSRAEPDPRNSGPQPMNGAFKHVERPANSKRCRRSSSLRGVVLSPKFL